MSNTETKYPIRIRDVRVTEEIGERIENAKKILKMRKTNLIRRILEAGLDAARFVDVNVGRQFAIPPFADERHLRRALSGHRAGQRGSLATGACHPDHCGTIRETEPMRQFASRNHRGRVQSKRIGCSMQVERDR